MSNDRLTQALADFKAILAEERGKRGRDYVRKLPQGLLLDALDAGRPDTSHDRAAGLVIEPTGEDLQVSVEDGALLICNQSLSARSVAVYEVGTNEAGDPNRRVVQIGDKAYVVEGETS